MEGVGLLSLSPANDPAWIVVKGISDFADEDRDAVIEGNRPLACGNAADFVLDALLNARHA
jgi:adenosylhomocysteine nucleosidase